MPRAKTRVASRQRRKKILKQTSGFFKKKSNCIRVAKDALWHAGKYAYRDRKDRKGSFRSLWIQRINAAARQNGMNYGRFISGLSKKGILINRKMLAELAMFEPESFKKLVEQAKA
jgi:large subunit ribosomal protein L20